MRFTGFLVGVLPAGKFGGRGCGPRCATVRHDARRILRSPDLQKGRSS